MLHPLTHFINSPLETGHNCPNYWYEGQCPQTGAWFKLPRSPQAEAIAQGLMNYLAADQRYAQEGKMYGVLLVELPSGEQQVIKAFSGLLNGCAEVEGWVPAIPGRDRVALEEAATLAALDTIRDELLLLQTIPQRNEYAARSEEFENQLRDISERHRLKQQQRQQNRETILLTLGGEELEQAIATLNAESQMDGIERRRFKQKRNAVLQPLQEAIDRADEQIRSLKLRRKQLSRQLQSQMHSSYRLTNFAGQSLSLYDLLTNPPTGTGECCAPKLLHYAATHRLKPIALAEFWWGPPPADGSKRQGKFYGACADRCQPLMGFLLSGLANAAAAKFDVPILYEDDRLIAVDKPAGLLSVPGRYRDLQDSVLLRLQERSPDQAFIPAHRLDQDTSGILLLAKDQHTYRHLSSQFHNRQINKQYEAILDGVVAADSGTIDLPLWGNPGDRPRQSVSWQYGKASITRFQVIRRCDASTWVEFIPLTGRTHQLRVHAAAGLGVPIRGDRLYGSPSGSGDRLYLHARSLHFVHPATHQPIEIQSPICLFH